MNFANLFDMIYGVIWRGMTSNEKGVRDVIDSDDLFDSRPAINRAFHHCRKLAKVLYCHGWEFTRGLFPHVQICLQSDREHGDDYLEFKEFRIFLRTLRQFFEYHQAFKRFGKLSISKWKYGNCFRLDTGEDQRISKEEFTDDSVKKTIETVSFLLLRDQPEHYILSSSVGRPGWGHWGWIWQDWQVALTKN